MELSSVLGFMERCSIDDCVLEENVTIDIKPDVPLLLGHQVDVCLAISEEE